MHINAARAQQAAEVLDLEDLYVLTPDQVVAAYRAKAKACHPDSGTYDAKLWAAISDARPTLIAWLEARAAALGHKPANGGTCRACAGQGFTQSRRGFAQGPRMRCVLCEGTGNIIRKDRDA